MSAHHASINNITLHGQYSIETCYIPGYVSRDKCDSSMGKSYNTPLSSRSSTSVKTSPDMATTSVIDIESFRQLLQQELDPMKKDIVTLTNNVQSIQTTLKDVMDTAEKSEKLNLKKELKGS